MRIRALNMELIVILELFARYLVRHFVSHH